MKSIVRYSGNLATTESDVRFLPSAASPNACKSAPVQDCAHRWAAVRTEPSPRLARYGAGDGNRIYGAGATNPFES